MDFVKLRAASDTTNQHNRKATAKQSKQTEAQKTWQMQIAETKLSAKWTKTKVVEKNPINKTKKFINYWAMPAKFYHSAVLISYRGFIKLGASESSLLSSYWHLVRCTIHTHAHTHTHCCKGLALVALILSERAVWPKNCNLSALEPFIIFCSPVWFGSLDVCRHWAHTHRMTSGHTCAWFEQQKAKGTDFWLRLRLRLWQRLLLEMSHGSFVAATCLWLRPASPPHFWAIYFRYISICKIVVDFQNHQSNWPHSTDLNLITIDKRVLCVCPSILTSWQLWQLAFCCLLNL